MKRKLLAVTVAITAMLTLSVHAQLGGLGGLGKKPTAESINADLFGGMDFFGKAIEYLDQALVPAEKAAELSAQIKAAVGNHSSSAIKDHVGRVSENVEALIAAKKPLDDRQRELVDKANGEITKGIAKWGALAAATAMAAKEGGGGAAMATALPLAQQAVQDLPAVKKLSDSIKALKKLK